MMSLPKDFIWGFGTASYQIEGAVANEGRGPSIWDTFCDIPGKIADGTSGRQACESYTRAKEDIDLLKEYGAKAYRFSISWSRIIPLGGRKDPINQQGLDHYVRFVDDLLAAGITPLVTLFQWDLPQMLHDRYGGPLNKDEFVADFTHYAKVVFRALGSRVHHWTTFTEPHNIAVTGYQTGVYAPGLHSDRYSWIVGHSLLVAHGSVVKVFRDEFQPLCQGKIGITLNVQWAEPWDDSDRQDLRACETYLDFTIGWFAEPIYAGRYPESMVQQLGDRLPEWSPEDIALVRGSNDFFALDYYTACFIKHKKAQAQPGDFLGNTELHQYNSHGQCIGPETDSAWLRAYPRGLRKVLNWISRTYKKPDIYILENGTSCKGEDDKPLQEVLHDTFRCDFYREHIHEAVMARNEDGINLLGYMAWSLMDNFEWNDGFRVRFGVTYVDYKNGMKRYPKDSAKLISELFRGYIDGDDSCL
ncbi:glycoside hydrolase superfamily [Aspergillus bertholletiae]|uniref:beta-glucosidase n=1 Tax=Aspergillus bertholletiae TaxID=1226010 RepID=A0A5N7BBC3_9EURO|nr:glycoside hydrolase superfamily [Aspergillus bertholletiae]